MRFCLLYFTLILGDLRGFFDLSAPHFSPISPTQARSQRPRPHPAISSLPRPITTVTCSTQCAHLGCRNGIPKRQGLFGTFAGDANPGTPDIWGWIIFGLGGNVLCLAASKMSSDVNKHLGSQIPPVENACTGISQHYEPCITPFHEDRGTLGQSEL